MSMLLCDLLQTTANLHKRIMNAMLARFNLTYAQYLVLKQLDAKEGLAAKILLDQLDTDKATLSGIVSRLEKYGWISRQTDAKDRRLMHIFLTDYAREHLPQVIAKERSCEDDILSHFKNREAKNFKDLFVKLIDNQKDALTQYLTTQEESE